MNGSNCGGSKKCSKFKQIKIRVEEDTYELICSTAKEHKLKIAVLIRAVLKDRLETFNRKCRYADTEQSEKIEVSCREISKELRHINNNITRIGINYNQEVRLKNAERKYKAIAEDAKSSPLERSHAMYEYNKVKREITEGSLDMNELNNILSQLRKSVSEMEDMLCLIQE